MPVFHSNVDLPVSAEAVFRFFLRPANLVDVTLPELNLRFVEAPEEVVVGSVVEFEVTHFGQAIRASHEVVRADDLCIAEQQIKGVMKSWEQSRSIVPVSDTACRVENTITFEGPGGLVGVIMNEDRIRASLDKGFTFQNQRLLEKFGGA